MAIWAILVFLVGMVAPALALAADGGTGFDPFAPFNRVVVLGSSTAAGTGPTDPDSAWAKLYFTGSLAIDPTRNFNNLALGGLTTYHLMPTGYVPPPGRPTPNPLRNIHAALAQGGDFVIINLPSNDMVQGFTIAEQLSNYDAILAVADSADVPVWITTTQPRNASAAIRADLMAMRDSTLARWGPKAIDFWTQVANPDGTIDPLYDSGDGIHLNDAAHGILFARVWNKNIWGDAGVGVTIASSPPETIRLHPATPNPFRGRTTLSYSVAEAARVTLDLFDVRGRKVGTLEDRFVPAGRHSLDYDAGSLPDGVYFFRLSTAEGSLSRRLVRVR